MVVHLSDNSREKAAAILPLLEGGEFADDPGRTKTTKKLLMRNIFQGN
jgi:hypothetical protein